jgi:hypothetical protein
MCPACVTSSATLIAGVLSAGGFAAIVTTAIGAAAASRSTAPPPSIPEPSAEDTHVPANDRHS